VSQPHPPTSQTSGADPVLADLVEELTTRLQVGQAIDWEDYYRRHPAQADDLRRLRPQLRALADLGTSAVLDAAALALAPDHPGAVLGDYRVLREVGRGGMGVVYEAEQVSLGRKVALKVLPFAAALDARQLQRFKNEAQAAAQLHHSNIVPVFGVGCERGVHFYAMQYIEGQTLAALIGERRQRAGLGPASPSSPAPCPPLGGASAAAAGAETVQPPAGVLATEWSLQGGDFSRTAARLGLQAAEALEHAHQMGVVHRDVKPGNLMVDGRGHLWVTDFGLAQIQADVGLTRTGDLLGTMRYLSPEQAQGKRELVDHRTDVYALGVTLYELLTLQPAFGDNDRAELLRQITLEEPRPPGRLNRAVPAELEIIVLKAMTKDPAERYATAQELADDLRRFLEDKPIQARRPSLRQRLARWMRRHRTWVTSAALSLFVVLLVSVGVLAVSFKQVNNALQERDETLRQERQTAYTYRIALAHREWVANRVGRADFLLDECPGDLRHWEWHYLKRLCHADLLTLRGDIAAFRATFLPDGHLGSVGLDRVARVWDPTTGREVTSFRGPSPPGTGVAAFSPDGSRLVLPRTDHHVDVWDTRTAQTIFTLRGHTGGVSDVAFSRDRNFIASASYDGTVKVWDAANGCEIRTLRPGSRVLSVALGPDGNRLAAGCTDGWVRVWDLEKGEETRAWQGHPRLPVALVAFSPNGRHIASVSRGEAAKVWDAVEGKEVFTLAGKRPGDVIRVAFDPDGRRIASTHFDQIVKVWDVATRGEAFTLRGHTGEVLDVAFSADGKRLASTGADKVVKVWELAGGQEARSVGTGAGPRLDMAFGSGGRVLTLAAAKGTLQVIDLATGQVSFGPRYTFKTLDGVLALSPDGRRLATYSSDRTIRILDTHNWAETARSQGQVPGLNRLAFSPDGRRLASFDRVGLITIWDADNGAELLTLRGHTRQATGVVAFSPDGRRLASAGADDETVRVWDALTGEERLCLRGHEGRALDVAFSPDGRSLASAGDDRTVRLWDAETGQPLRTLGGHPNRVTAVAFSPDGLRVASATSDGDVILWDLSAGREMLTLEGRGCGLASLAFSPDGKRLVAVDLDRDGTLRIWDGTPWDDNNLRGEP
jgi:WD40 repeat protein/serine/threonine protein kinase